MSRSCKPKARGSSIRAITSHAASSTLGHLHGAIRVAGLRRGIRIELYENEYGQYRQELEDRESSLHQFRPNYVMLAIDAHHASGGANASDHERAITEASDRIVTCWRLAREAFNCPVIQQTLLPVFSAILGSNEHRLTGSPARAVARLNEALRNRADEEGVDLLALDARAAQDGLYAWHDRMLWHAAKQEVTPRAAPVYGDLVARLIAAKRGRSAKCLVLDLDNTIWGGVVGDDGLEGLVLGQGSAGGEAFLSVQ
jgi:predicted enzyme involved in methoxymalonyl-ACP biosynthesis